MSDFITEAKKFVQKQLEKNDASHDWSHIERVYKLALTLAKEEKITDEKQLEIIAMAALLHDVGDYKYTGSETAGVEMCQKFLEEIKYPKEDVEKILFVIKNLSFRNELSTTSSDFKPTIELAIVKDADRLDAIGAIGIARCMIYAGTKNLPLHDPNLKQNIEITKEEYMRKENTVINHFYEKLLKLKALMMTNAGKKFAERRHKFMEDYLKQFFEEWNGNL